MVLPIIAKAAKVATSTAVKNYGRKAAKINKAMTEVAQRGVAGAVKQKVLTDATKSRRRATRQLNKIEKLLTGEKTVTGEVKNALVKTGAELYKSMQGTKLERSEYGKAMSQGRSQDIREATNKLDTLTRSAKMIIGKQGLTNFMVQAEINAASVGNEDFSGGKTQEETKVFYRATQRFWEGAKDTDNRNKLIMRGLGFSNLQDAWDYVMSQDSVKQALEYAYSEESIDEGDRTSPSYTSIVEMIEPNTYGKEA